jgi:hypothetical protein
MMRATALGLAMLAAPGVADAQSMDDVLAVQAAIRAELARPGSGIAPNSIGIANVRFEGEFATADVSGANFNAPIVFVKLSDGRWRVVLVGAEVTAEDCQQVGFPSGSQMCRN